MNTILKFDPRRRDRDYRPPKPETSAEIILFPGVRYERREDGQTQTVAKGELKEG
ncbi:MAG: hypothetical protein K5872_04710 [Rhizobiaceae bacterium]|nr:hypothetical protein [Rhizobiaceae bacterium]MCV0405511.1 hypothetical protein [Rhizobiaceae bacterium]